MVNHYDSLKSYLRSSGLPDVRLSLATAPAWPAEAPPGRPTVGTGGILLIVSCNHDIC